MKNLAAGFMVFFVWQTAQAALTSETLTVYLEVVLPTMVEQSLSSAKIESVRAQNLKPDSLSVDEEGLEAKFVFQERNSACTLQVRSSSSTLMITNLYADLNCLSGGERTHGTFLKSTDSAVRKAIIEKLDALANRLDARPDGTKSKCTLHPKVKLSDELTARSLVNDRNPLIQEIRRAANLEIRTLEVRSWQECFREAHKIVSQWKNAAPGSCAEGTALREGVILSRRVRHDIYLEWQLDDGFLGIPYTNSYGYLNCHTQPEPKLGDQTVSRER